MIPNDAAAPFNACQSRGSKTRGRRRWEYARRIGPDCEPHLRVQLYCLRVQLQPPARGRALNPKGEKQARGRQLSHVLAWSASVGLCHIREHAGSENAPPIPTCRMNSNMSVNRPHSYNEWALPPRAHLRASPMGHCTPTIIMQTLRDIREKGAPADGGVPSSGVHAELLKIREIDDDRAVLAADAEVGEAVAPAARLNLEPLRCGALHDRRDLIRASGTRYRRRGDAEGSVVWLYGGELVE